MKFEKNTELDQANLRLIVATCAILYVVLIGLLPGLKVETYLPIVAYYGLFLIASILLRQAIVRWPGHYPARRIFCMLHDYAGTSFGLIVGGEAALPLYAVMVWINLGNGMRYGSRYLAIATALALLALLVIYRLTPAWQAQPFMVLMLMTTSTVIPFYAHLLLERTRKATIGRQMVREGRWQIAQIAYRLGYSSPENFTHAYRARFGHPPGRE